MQAMITIELVGLIVALGIALAMWTKTVIKAELSEQMKEVHADLTDIKEQLATGKEKMENFDKRLERAGINGKHPHPK